MFGYWAIGRNTIAARPNKAMKALTTVANRGWSMKKCASFMALVLIGAAPDGTGLRRYLRSRRGRFDAVDNDPIGEREARADDPEAAAKIAQLDSLGGHHV